MFKQFDQHFEIHLYSVKHYLQSANLGTFFFYFVVEGLTFSFEQNFAFNYINQNLF